MAEPTQKAPTIKIAAAGAAVTSEAPVEHADVSPPVDINQVSVNELISLAMTNPKAVPYVQDAVLRLTAILDQIKAVETATSTGAAAAAVAETTEAPKLKIAEGTERTTTVAAEAMAVTSEAPPALKIAEGTEHGHGHAHKHQKRDPHVTQPGAIKLG